MFLVFSVVPHCYYRGIVMLNYGILDQTGGLWPGGSCKLTLKEAKGKAVL